VELKMTRLNYDKNRREEEKIENGIDGDDAE